MIQSKATHKSPRSYAVLGRAANKSIGQNKRHEFLKESVRYDPQTGLFISAYKDDVNVKGSYDNKGQLFITVNSRKYAADRLAWFLVTGSWPKRKIQHKNGDIGDNRFNNLEEVRCIERKISSTRLPEGVHYSESDRKWVGVVCRHNQYYNLGRYTSKVIAMKAVAKFINKLNEGELNNKDDYQELINLKTQKQLCSKNCVSAYQRVLASNILIGWGAWAYQDVRECNENVISKMMVSNAKRISDTALIGIIEELYSKGFKGKELFQKASDVLAALRHRQAESLPDKEAMYVDQLLPKIFGRNSPIIKIAVNYYVYGHSIKNIAVYIQKITDYQLTEYQAKNRVCWCLNYLKDKFYQAYIHSELDKN